MVSPVVQHRATPLPRDGHHDGARQLRVMLYSHDSWGLGHLRRSLAIAGELTGSGLATDVLIVTGSPCATQFDLADRCDVLKLPAIGKDAEGQYVPRSLSSDLTRTIRLRSQLIMQAYEAFDPHLVIVDHQLTGMLNEALQMLQQAFADKKPLIYGMRDVLDSPEVVARDWGLPEHDWALNTAYDRICVYGTPEVFDPRLHYSALRPLCDRIRFLGYVVAPLDPHRRQPIPSLRKRVLVTVGGGEDGVERISAYLRCLCVRPAGWDSLIVCGPLMNTARVREFKRFVYRNGLAGQVVIRRFVKNLPQEMQETDAVVAMAGYNSCCEIMQSRVPAVYLPRRHPRKEQLIRAERLQEMGLAASLPDPSPKALRHAVEAALQRKTIPSGFPSLDGLRNVRQVIQELLASRSPSTARPMEAANPLVSTSD